MGRALTERETGILRSYARRIDPSDAAAHNNLGDALRAQGKLNEAVSAYAEALRADPGFAQASENFDSAKRELEGQRDQ